MRPQQPKSNDEETILPDPARTTPFPLQPLRKKGAAAGVRTWLLLDSTGTATVVDAGKHSIMRRTGLPARDLRILDPMLSYPSTVLGRERAIVINLEHIKAIITAQEVLLLNSKDPSVVPFVDELQKRILQFHHAVTATREGKLNGDDPDWTNFYETGEPLSRAIDPENHAEHEASLESFSGEDSPGGFPNFKGFTEEGKDDGKLENHDGLKVLPFEFVALEACLEAACSCLENEARTLEQEAHPALDKLTSKISTLNLERVRQIKSRLVAITGRVQKVRDELEHLLDDDEDMAEMYLTDKMIEQNLDGSSASSTNEGDGIAPHMSDRMPSGITEEVNEEDDIQNDYLQERLFQLPRALSRDSHGTRTSATHSAIRGILCSNRWIFKQIINEDYINIMLDDKQNHLLQMGVMLTTATLIISACVVVAGLFGMNIHIHLFDDKVDGNKDFLWTVGGSTVGGIFIYIVAIAWCKHKRLLE